MYSPDNLVSRSNTEDKKDIMRRFCAELPENRILHGADDFDALVEKDRYRKSLSLIHI